MTDTTSAAFFEAKYKQSADPWDFANSAYEQQRYAATMAALHGRHFQHAWEPGCSVGVLTEKLAAICRQVNASDISPTAVHEAQQRCASLPGVSVTTASFLDQQTVAGYDLLVWSEIGYYMTREVWASRTSSLLTGLQTGATLLAVHWLGHSPDHLQSGDEVHEALLALPHLQLEISERHPADNGGFRLDLWRKTA